MLSISVRWDSPLKKLELFTCHILDGIKLSFVSVSQPCRPHFRRHDPTSRILYIIKSA